MFLETLDKIKLPAILLMFMLLACGQISLPQENVCFDETVVALVKRDCALCHSNGEYGVKLSGSNDDFDRLLKYVSVKNSANSILLNYTIGDFEHPPIWNDDSAEYKTVAAWIDEGARASCSFNDQYGDCRTDSDCPIINCLCPDLTMAETSKCFVNSETGLGTCPTDVNCHMEQFGACAPDNAEDGDFELEQELEEPDGDLDLEPETDGDDDLDTEPEIELEPEIEEEATTQVVSFKTNIVPMLGSDCARCHAGGGWGVDLSGQTSDYSEVMRYVDLDDPEGNDSFLSWAAGQGRHPLLWRETGNKYQLFLQWVLQGAENN